MRFIHKISGLLAFIIFFNCVLNAQQLKFRHLTIEDGLSQSSVNCMMQDSKGFLWFGTQDGLNRYDGYKFNVYRNNPDNQNSITHNWIWDIIEDNENNIWVATWHGLARYNPNKNRFTRFFPDSTNLNSIAGARPASFCMDSSGYIWIATWGGGLSRFDPVERNLHETLYIS